MTFPHPRALIATLLAVALVCFAASTVVGSDGLDTLLGGVAGACTSVAVGVLVLDLLERRSRRDAGDQRALDRLEPLRAARRDDR